MRILIATGIYPPEIGGPAEYAKNLEYIWRKDGHKVRVRIFSKFQKIPWGLRHILFFFYVLPSVVWADRILTLEAFSAGLVTIAAKLFTKTVIFRTGGDLLWESYVERTGDMVLLREFYQTKLGKLSIKEKIIFFLMKWTLRNLSGIIWSTEWQRDIFMKPYRLEKQKHFIVENFYGPRLSSESPKQKNFIAATRVLKWKNLRVLRQVFAQNNIANTGAILDTKHRPHDEFLRSIQESYAVIVTSLGDISPNTILDAIRCKKPFILTRENGLTPRIKDIALFVDPKNGKDIEQKVLWLCDEQNYEVQKKKLEAFTFTHTWVEIADEYMAVYCECAKKTAKRI